VCFLLSLDCVFSLLNGKLCVFPFKIGDGVYSRFQTNTSPEKCQYLSNTIQHVAIGGEVYDEFLFCVP
jgi:hypothetical protein